MIPSDHFTRFYNEVFKFLESKGQEDLELYWLEISKNQEKHILDLIKTKGLQGMYEYWSVIEEEENCDLDLTVDDDHLELHMHGCPSLAKVMDNDAAPMTRYCDHCAGWIGPIMDKTGYHLVYDAISRTEPRCVMRIYKDAEKAKEAEKSVQLLMGWPGKQERG
ncbi:hypothetical protein [Devosia sp.]|jgi:hypothetical protein|uniref:hypothetical protein n=1 Tax=Devosia sp. TaxID=1871048 RepID=UPI001AC2362B|nr:hypothetical protein [Devosia sp.]MBN9332399.1 hypothetical protein [Devosia sp.]